MFGSIRSEQVFINIPQIYLQTVSSELKGVRREEREKS